jgi:hypothetical protein
LAIGNLIILDLLGLNHLTTGTMFLSALEGKFDFAIIYLWIPQKIYKELASKFWVD